MEIIDELRKKSVWQEFLEYKKEKSILSKKETNSDDVVGGNLYFPFCILLTNSSKVSASKGYFPRNNS